MKKKPNPIVSNALIIPWALIPCDRRSTGKENTGFEQAKSERKRTKKKVLRDLKLTHRIPWENILQEGFNISLEIADIRKMEIF